MVDQAPENPRPPSSSPPVLNYVSRRAEYRGASAGDVVVATFAGMAGVVFLLGSAAAFCYACVLAGGFRELHVPAHWCLIFALAMFVVFFLAFQIAAAFVSFTVNYFRGVRGPSAGYADNQRFDFPIEKITDTVIGSGLLVLLWFHALLLVSEYPGKEELEDSLMIAIPVLAVAVLLLRHGWKWIRRGRSMTAS